MMTNEIFPNKDLLSQNHHFPGIYQEGTSPQPYVGTFHNQDFPSRKRQTLYRWCSRITASGFAGSDLVIEYIYGKYIQNLSIHTIRQSSSIILSFLDFLDKNSQTIYDLTRQNISSFVDDEQDRGLKTESIIHHLEALYAFIAFLVEREVLPHTIKQHKIKLKKPDSLPRAIPGEDIQFLLATISNIQDRALILLLLRTGMRIGELLEVKISDIIFSERKILIYQGEKNYQGRAVYYSEDAEYALQQWLYSRNKNSEYLFSGGAERQLSYTTAWRIMHKALQDASLRGKGYSLHSLRHTFATEMLNAGMRIEVLQQLLGHQEIGITMRYAKLADRTRELEYFRAMDRIKKGRHYEPDRINTQLQKVFEEKKLLHAKHKKLSE
jgi:site-specific recombinase XerD